MKSTKRIPAWIAMLIALMGMASMAAAPQYIVGNWGSSKYVQVNLTDNNTGAQPISYAWTIGGQAVCGGTYYNGGQEVQIPINGCIFGLIATSQIKEATLQVTATDSLGNSATGQAEIILGYPACILPPQFNSVAFGQCATQEGMFNAMNTSSTATINLTIATTITTTIQGGYNNTTTILQSIGQGSGSIGTGGYPCYQCTQMFRRQFGGNLNVSWWNHTSQTVWIYSNLGINRNTGQGLP